jgi:hypothetical protein
MNRTFHRLAPSLVAPRVPAFLYAADAKLPAAMSSILASLPAPLTPHDELALLHPPQRRAPMALLVAACVHTPPCGTARKARRWV